MISIELMRAEVMFPDAQPGAVSARHHGPDLELGGNSDHFPDREISLPTAKHCVLLLILLGGAGVLLTGSMLSSSPYPPAGSHFLSTESIEAAMQVGAVLVGGAALFLLLDCCCRD